jgi:hypothetical protein
MSSTSGMAETGGFGWINVFQEVDGKVVLCVMVEYLTECLLKDYINFQITEPPPPKKTTQNTHLKIIGKTAQQPRNTNRVSEYQKLMKIYQSQFLRQTAILH